ncbi:AI-2E family transporter [Lysobacter korlensis]|uniref:AI-2E family transporter n=1 Tax=Lysobacter korlensis TaxID=553636 RepID=A0ABV6RRB5_9GAMM
MFRIPRRRPQDQAQPDPGSGEVAPVAGPPQSPTVVVAEPSAETRPPASLWTDGFGRTAVRSAQVLLVLAVSVAVVYALIQLRIAVIPVLIALLLAAAIGPLVNFLRRRNLPSALATWIALLAVLIVVGGIVTTVVFAVRREWGTLVEQASEGLGELQTWLTESSPIPIDDEQIEEARTAAIDFFTSSQFASGAVSGAVAVGEVIAGLLLTIVVLFFFLKDGGKIWTFLVERLGGSHKPRMRRAGARAMEVLGGYVRGTAIIAAVDTVVIGGTLLILQVPLALPLALIVFVGAFIPLVGATLSGILAALVALVANGPVAALVVIIVVILVNQLEGDLLAPFVLGKSLNLHALVVLLALAAGTILGGITGAILSVPIAAVAWAVIKTWKGEEAPQGTMGKPA